MGRDPPRAVHSAGRRRPGALSAIDFQRANADGQTFVYSDSGEGPLVVLLHGFPDLPQGWADAAAVLNDAGYRTVVPYLRGYHPDTIVAGRDYSGERIAEDAVRLLDALGERDCVLVGHDWGAFIAYRAAASAPERFRAICPVALPHPRELKLTPSVAWAARHFLVNRLPWATWIARQHDYAYLDTLYSRWAPGWSGPDRDAAVQEAKDAFRDPRVLDAAFGYYRNASGGGVGRVSVPALVVGDTQDGGDPESFNRTPDHFDAPCEVWIAQDVGHWPHREASEEFHTRLVAFLGGLT